MQQWKRNLKKVWHFVWEDDSVWSWIVNVILAFILIKFVVYPGLSFALSTSHPVVAVVSESMEHNENFDSWWGNAGKFYAPLNIRNEDFESFPLKNGFNKGDIVVLRGKKPENIKIGDVIVFWSAKREPIIHRVVKKWREDGIYYFQTKGDNYKTNRDSIISKDQHGRIVLDETRISQDKIVGNSVFRVPLLGYLKIWFVELLGWISGLLGQIG